MNILPHALATAHDAYQRSVIYMTCKYVTVHNVSNVST